jgi:hypothetical protein
MAAIDRAGQTAAADTIVRAGDERSARSAPKSCATPPYVRDHGRFDFSDRRHQFGDDKFPFEESYR